MLHVHWLSPYQPANLEQVGASNLASVRLRAGALLAALPSDLTLSFGTRAPDKTGLIIAGKLGGDAKAAERGQDWIRQMRELRARGGKVVLDFTDDHLGIESAMTPFYRTAMDNVDLVVCSSALLARNLGNQYQGRLEVIPDAIEIPTIPPKQYLHSPITALWFGHASNLRYLVDFLPRLAMPEPLRLIVLCNAEGLQMLQSSPPAIPRNIQAEGGVWSVPAMLDAARQSDLCIIPSDPSDRRKAGVSSNRLLTALAMGLPTAADLLDSYTPFSEFFTDIRSSSFLTLLRNPLDSAGKTAQAQEALAGGYTLAKVGEEWVRIAKALETDKSSDNA